jgi:hypothetical protein
MGNGGKPLLIRRYAQQPFENPKLAVRQAEAFSQLPFQTVISASVQLFPVALLSDGFAHKKTIEHLPRPLLE